MLKYLISRKQKLLRSLRRSTEEELYRHTFGRWLYNEDLRTFESFS